MSKTTNDLAKDGWRSVTLEYNAYITNYFDEHGLDPENLQRFIEHEIDDYQLVELSEANEYDYALQREQEIE